MKKQLLFSTLAAIMLSACGSGITQNEGTQNAETITAFHIFKMLNPDMAAESTNADSSDRMYFNWEDKEDEFSGSSSDIWLIVALVKAERGGSAGRE